MLVIVNPGASAVSAPLERRVLDALGARFAVEAVRTRGPGVATGRARDATAQGYDLVVALGGDGTVREVAEGLIGSGTPLAVLPGGATNVFARLLGLPRDVLDAVECLLQMAGRLDPGLIDTGRANGRTFLFSAGAGLSASMVERVERRPRLKARLGRHHFAYAALRTFLGEYLRDPPRVRVEVEGVAIEGVTAIAQNADPLSFFGSLPLHVAPAAGLETGSLSVSVLERARITQLVTLLPRLFGRGAAEHPHVRSIEARAPVRVTALGEPFPLELDGDPQGSFYALELTVAPRSLAILRPVAGQLRRSA